MAMHFATNAYGLIGTGSINHGIGTGDFTWCAWVKLNSAPAASGRVVALCGDLNNGGLMAEAISANPWGMYWGSNYTFGVSLTAGRWYHILATRIAGTLYGYTDGVLSATTHNIAAKSMAAGSVCIGSDAGGSFRAQASVAHIGLFSGGCGIAEARAIATGEPSPRVLGLPRFWASCELADKSGRVIDEGPGRVQFKSLFSSAGNYPTWAPDGPYVARPESPRKSFAATAATGGYVIGSGIGSGTVLGL